MLVCVLITLRIFTHRSWRLNMFHYCLIFHSLVSYSNEINWRKAKLLITTKLRNQIFTAMKVVICSAIDLMHWRHASITRTPCWGSRLVALRAHVLLAERIGAHPLSQCAHPGQLGGEACRGLPSECMLGDGARGVPRLTPNTTGAPFCDVICIWSITV